MEPSNSCYFAMSDGDIINGPVAGLETIGPATRRHHSGFQTVFLLVLLAFYHGSNRANTLGVAGVFMRACDGFSRGFLLALIPVGMWLGMTESKWNVAVRQNAPVRGAGALFALVIHSSEFSSGSGSRCIVVRWAEKKLHTEFRPVAARCGTPSTKPAGWLEAARFWWAKLGGREVAGRQP